MVIFGHTGVGAMTGIAVYAAASSLPLTAVLAAAFLAGIVSHYITDWIPHGHYHINLGYPNLRSKTAIAVDAIGSVLLILGLALISFGFTPLWWVLFATIAGALLPDIVEMLQEFRLLKTGPWLRAHRRFHHDTLHWHNRDNRPLPWRWIDLWQVGVVVISIVLIFEQ